MSVAYQYGKCYWNASGEFDCLNQSSEQYVNKRVLENSIKKDPQGLPLENTASFSQPNTNYAHVPISRKNLRRDILEPYEGNIHTESNNQCRKRKLDTIPKDTSRNMCPLAREMEISVYLPDRDTRFPWEQNQKQENMNEHPTKNTKVESMQANNNFFQPLPINTDNGTQQQVYTPTQSTIAYSVTNESNVMPMNLKWHRETKFPKLKKNTQYYQLPIKRYENLLSEIGTPTLINPNQGGLAIWQKSTLAKTKYNMIKRIDLIDEQIFNSFPYPHIGYLYTYIKLPIPMNKLGHVLSISSDIMYDTGKKILIVRGMSLNYNLAISALICSYVTGHITWYNIIENNLVKKATTLGKLRSRKFLKQNLTILSQISNK